PCRRWAMTASAAAVRDCRPAIPVATTKTGLTDAQRRFVGLCQHVRYGRVHSLTVRAGEPVLSPGPWLTRKVKVPGENGPHPASSNSDFALKDEVREFFRLLAVLGDGEILNVEVRNGLPVSF